MTVELREVTKHNWEQVVKLPLSEEQRKFVAPNWYSLLEAAYESETLTARAAYDGFTLVGFTMYGYEDEARQYWVDRLMVSTEHQRKGYGRAIMQQVIGIHKLNPDCKALFISFEPENHVAQALYESLGFQDTGQIRWDEKVYRLSLEETTNGG